MNLIFVLLALINVPLAVVNFWMYARHGYWHNLATGIFVCCVGGLILLIGRKDAKQQREHEERMRNFSTRRML